MKPEPIRTPAEQAIFQLFLLTQRTDELIRKTKRRRTISAEYRDSIIASEQKRLDALNFAINHIKGVIKP